MEKTNYNIYFIPKLEDRKKISKLRQEFCKKTFSTQALQYPVHLSLTSGTQIKNYKEFELELKNLCKNSNSINLKTNKTITILEKYFWSGISFEKTKELNDLKIKIEKLKNKYSIKKRILDFKPHITLTYPARVEDLKTIKNPITNLKLNRITIVKRTNKGEKYKILKHINLKK